MFKRSLLCGLLLAAALGLAPPALALPPVNPQAEAAPRPVVFLGPRVKQQKASSAAEAARIAQRRYGGKILKVETLRTPEGLRYRVRILQDNGRVRTVIIQG